MRDLLSVRKNFLFDMSENGIVLILFIYCVSQHNFFIIESPVSVRRGRRSKKMSLKAIEALENEKESSEDDEKLLICDTSM